MLSRPAVPPSPVPTAMRITVRNAVAVISLALLVPSSVSAQANEGQGLSARGGGEYPIDPEAAPRPVLRAVRTEEAIVVDGDISEGVWASADVATDFVQSKPLTGYPGSERTEVRILYDDERLYIGAIMFDREPELLVAQRMEQDFLSPDEDVFGIALDTFLDKANAYYFFVNPNGALRDAQAYDNSRTSNAEWEGVMEVASKVRDDGWSTEISIPFSTLRFDPALEEQTWGLNMVRRVRRRGEDAVWAPIAFRTRIHKMAEAGTLVGLRGLRAGRNITVKPFALSGNVSGSVPPEDELGRSFDGGVDVKWGITPRVTADLTWRTDFSQVEVDQEQVNLTRFSLFFPEKRDFFIENAGTFQFGDLSEREYRLGAGPRDFTLFHSRRIGLEAGRPVPIVYGARVTGREWGAQTGLLHMQTEGVDARPGETFTVARVRRPIGRALEVGGMFINRQSGDPDDYNRSWGIDANARLAGNLILHSYLAGSLEPGVVGDNLAGRLSAAWRGPFWDVSALYRTFGENFRPGLGFVRRPAVRHSYATVGVHPRPPIRVVNEVNPYVEVERFVAPDGFEETRNQTAGAAVLFLDGGQLNVTGTNREEGLREDFTLSEGVVPAGRYEFLEGSASYTTSAARKVAGTARLSGGGYFQGDRRSFGGNVVWRPSAHVAVDVGADHNVIDLTGESFTVDVLSGRLDYAYSTRLFFGGWVQYNDATGVLVTNLRMNYIHAPLSDLFLVYSERRDRGSGTVLDRRLTAKLTKLLAF